MHEEIWWFPFEILYIHIFFFLFFMEFDIAG